MKALAYMASLSYQWGDLYAVRYDPWNSVFGDPTHISFLETLYMRTRRSGRKPLGVLPELFAGMSNLTCEAIVGYLSTRPVVVLGEWQERKLASDPGKLLFNPLGYAFIAQAIVGQPFSAAFCGYSFFQESWGTDKQFVLSLLGLSYLFQEFSLEAIHGQRYHDNFLTARWMRRFGFRDCGTVPSLLLRHDTKRLEPAVISTLAREDFEVRLTEILERSGVVLE